MISRQNNTWNTAWEEARAIPLSLSKLFWKLWSKRGRWVSEVILTVDLGESHFKLIESIVRLEQHLSEYKIETYYSSESDQTYYRLIGPYMLPEPTRTGHATLPETDQEPDVVSIDEAVMAGMLK